MTEGPRRHVDKSLAQDDLLPDYGDEGDDDVPLPNSPEPTGSKTREPDETETREPNEGTAPGTGWGTAPETDRETNGGTDRETAPETHRETHPGTNARTGPRANAGAYWETDAAAGWEPDEGTDPETDPGTDPGTDRQTNAGTGWGTDRGTDPETHRGTRPGTNARTGPRANAGAYWETDPGAGWEPDEGTDPETDPWGPSAARTPGPPRSHPCWSCAAAVPAGESACPECQESARYLRLLGPGSSIDLRHGEGPPLRLGRHPVWATAVAGALSGDRGKGVSRRHAELQLTPDGTMWLTECAHGTLNGTYVNDERLTPGTRAPVRDGDVIGLGRNCAFTVLLVEPDA
ncbi:FHA domain-containing protein [Streptomyces sp. YKOK-I1]